ERTTSACFLDGALDVIVPCSEAWELRELVRGARGVQHVTVGFQIDDGSRDGVGSGATVVRVFDRDVETAISVVLAGTRIAVIGTGERRAALEESARRALDLVARMHTVRFGDWTTADHRRLRAQLARIARVIAPALADSADWPGELVH